MSPLGETKIRSLAHRPPGLPPKAEQQNGAAGWTRGTRLRGRKGRATSLGGSWASATGDGGGAVRPSVRVTLRTATLMAALQLKWTPCLQDHPQNFASLS